MGEHMGLPPGSLSAFSHKTAVVFLRRSVRFSRVWEERVNTVPAWPGRPAPWAPSWPDGTGSLAWARWLSPSTRRGKKRERPWKKREWGLVWASSRGRHSNCCELTAGGSCQGDGRFPPSPPSSEGQEREFPCAWLRCHTQKGSEKSGVLGTELLLLPIWLASTNQSINRLSIYTPAQSPALPIAVLLVTTLPTRFLLHLEVPGKI